MLALLILILCCGAAHAEPLPPVHLTYRIEATLEPAERQIEGVVEAAWTHPGQAAVTAVPLHLYLNAFSHDQTTWMGGGPLRTVRFDDLQAMYGDDLWGWVDVRAITQRTPAGPKELTWTYIQPDDGNPLDRSLALVQLAEPIQPGQTLQLTVAFDAHLPTPIARTGATPGTLVGAQWFPKLAAYELAGQRGRASEGWSAQQFHGPTEFYADFADFEVTLRHPAGWTVAATGVAEPLIDEDKNKSSHYKQRAVHDFAFVASTELTARTFSVKPAGQESPVTVHLLQPAGLDADAPRWEGAIRGALDVMTSRVGPYPYATLTVVLPPWRAVRTSGMEYPTLITGLAGDPLWSTWPVDTFTFPEIVIIHEFIHQYFYGLLASQEREEAYLDEGLTTYWEGEVARSLYGDPHWLGSILGRPLRGDRFRALGLRRWAASLDEPIARRPTWLYYPGSSGAQVYPRTALSLRTAALLHGQEALDATFKAYYRRSAFTHPTLTDLLAAAAEVDPKLHDTLAEAFLQPRVPNYRVVTASSEPWSAPVGHLPDDLDPLAARALRDDAPEGARVEIIDPGTLATPGSVQRLTVPFAVAPAAAPAPDAPRYESTVRLRGPAWQHLPVTIRLEFADGARLDLPWDGRAPWRALRVLRAAPLTLAAVDPEGRIALDVSPEDNARALQPDLPFTADWSLWFGGVAAWLASGVTAWL